MYTRFDCVSKTSAIRLVAARYPALAYSKRAALKHGQQVCVLGKGGGFFRLIEPKGRICLEPHKPTKEMGARRDNH
jgi:hypothetical protein